MGSFFCKIKHYFFSNLDDWNICHTINKKAKLGKSNPQFQACQTFYFKEIHTGA